MHYSCNRNSGLVHSFGANSVRAYDRSIRSLMAITASRGCIIVFRHGPVVFRTVGCHYVYSLAQRRMAGCSAVSPNHAE